MRISILAALLLICFTSGIAAAQDTPVVEIVLSQPTAQQGDTVTASVYVRNAINVGGIDIGVTVDDQCLRIVDRQPGDYFPTSDTEGAFSPFAQLNEHDTRFASALTDRTRHVSGDGVFYTVQLEVTCPEGVASLNVSYAMISTYADPNAEVISLISYAQEDGTLNVVNAQLAIGAEGQVTAVATSAPAAPTSEPGVTPAAPTSAPADAQSTAAQRLPVVILGIIGLTVLGLVILFAISRRRKTRG